MTINSTTDTVQEVSPPPAWSPTNIIYMTYDGNFQTDCISTILEIIPTVQITGVTATSHENDTPTDDEQVSQPHQELSIVLDQTVMHAQGGGQPTDIGQIVVMHGQQEIPLVASASTTNTNDGNEAISIPDKATVPPNIESTTTTVIQIDKVLLDRSTGLVRHYGKIQSNDDNNNNSMNQRIPPQCGDIVHVHIDVNRRQILSECHTAGHVVDAAMVKCGYILQPSKGYHFLDSPYVEYLLNNSNDELNKNQKDVVQKLQYAFQELIDEDIPTQIELLSKEEADIRCNDSSKYETKFFDMDAFCTNDSENAIVRIVTVAGYPCPCGGTHVKSTGQLRSNQWGITGIKIKKGLVRVKYGQNVNISPN